MGPGGTSINFKEDFSIDQILHPVKILLIEDNPGDARLVKELLKSEEYFSHELKWISSLNEIDKQYHPDIILLDLNLPESVGLETFTLVKSLFADIPIVVQTGLDDSKTAHETVSNGAQDYIIKGNFTSSLLIKTLLYGIERNNLIVKLRNEKILHEREKIISEIFENASVAIYRTTPEGEFLVVNSSMVKMFGYSSQEEFKKINAKELYPNPNERMLFKNLLEKEKIVTGFEEKLMRKDKSVFATLESSKVVTDEKGNTYFEGVIEDISKRKEAEEALSELLKEKDVLLKELHHRTKNNMQVISSLIGLKATVITDESTKMILKDITARIRAIALIHQKLYQSKNLSHIDLKEYITELTDLLMESHSINSGLISLKLDLQSVFIQIDNAIQIGLLINELITNSLKYAFPGNRKGEILIELHRENEDDLILKICDNGIGVSNDFDFENSDSMGIQLVKAIAEDQLMGHVLFETKNGFSSIIRFKLKDI